MNPTTIALYTVYIGMLGTSVTVLVNVFSKRPDKAKEVVLRLTYILLGVITILFLFYLGFKIGISECNTIVIKNEGRSEVQNEIENLNNLIPIKHYLAVHILLFAFLSIINYLSKILGKQDKAEVQ